MIERRTVIDLSRKMDGAAGKDRKSIEEDRKKHLKGVIGALNKALALADTKTPVQKVDDARYYLCGAYIVYGDPYRAAIVGEVLGRGRTTRRSPEGAATAIQTYSVLQARNPDDVSVRQRLTDMANFVLSPEAQTTWKTEPVTSLAHYHLAMAAKREDNPKKAIAHLAALSKDFVDYIYTQGQLVFIAQAAREKAEDEKEKKFYIDAAKAALGRMPMYEKDDSPSVITMYYFAKLEMSKFMYSEGFDEINANQPLKAIKQFNQMAKYVKDMQEQIGKLSGKAISPENREQIEFSMQVMTKYADLGLAEAKFRDPTIKSPDRFDQVLAATKKVVDDVLKKGAATKDDIPMKDYSVTANILSLALRANVQKGNVEQGKAILDVLNRLSGAKGEKAGNVVGGLLKDISNQIQTMKESKDNTLEKTRDSYRGFLDVIAKEYEAKGNDINALHVLAHAYLSLDYPDKAAATFAKIKPPPGIDKPLPKKNDKMTEKELEELQQKEEAFSRYWKLQIEYIRALRAVKDKESFKKAEASVKGIIDNPHASYHIHAMVERGHLMDDQTRYREAVGGWAVVLKTLQPNLAKPEVQKIYFPSYYQWTRSLYLMSQHDKMLKDPQKFVVASANNIIKLEFSKSQEGWQIAGPMFAKLLKEKEFEGLKKEYDKQKAARMQTSAKDLLRSFFARVDREIFRPAFLTLHSHREPKQGTHS
jgi:hypothetical protein